MRIENKKGFLLAEETLKIVIALICIGFLVYFLGALYFNSQANKDLELARDSLKHLISESDSFASSGGEGTVEIYNPKGWYIVSWDKEGAKPDFCLNKDWEGCLCICDGDKKDECDDKGVCSDAGYTVAGNGIKIDPVPLSLKIDGGVISKNES